jgi:flagellar basal body-associated protein FliL
MSPTPAARRERHLTLLLVIVILLVGGITTSVTWHVSHRADRTSRGLAKANCVLIELIEQSSDQAARSADTQQKILVRLPKDDPTLPERRKARDLALRQVHKADDLAGRMREGVTCPPRRTP